MSSRVVRAAVEAIESRVLFAAPAVDAVANYSVPVGKTIQIPVTAASDAGAVTYGFRDSASNRDTVTGGFRQNNPFIEMRVAGYSQPMVFELFADTAPETVKRITGLVNSGFYDGLTFHRVINNFVVQGGDPAGDGSGGPAGEPFSDEFDPNTVFTGTGQLAMANSGKDTNGSQFFITEGPQRLLDFNHTIFGQLVRGEATRQAISDLGTNAGGTPNDDVVITSVNVVNNNTDDVLLLRANAPGTYTVRVIGTNADGSTSRSFTLTAAADTVNDPPILNTRALQTVYYTTPGRPVTITPTSIDAEGTAANFFVAQFVNQNGATGAYSGTNNTSITITPTATGATTLRIGVIGSNSDQSRGSTSLAQGDDTGISIADSQLVTIVVGDLPISAAGQSVEVTSGAANRVLVGTFRDSDAGGTAANFTANIDWGDGTVSPGVVSKSRNGRFAVYGTKTYAGKVSGTVPITTTITGNLGATAVASSTAVVRPATDLAGGILTVNGTNGDDRIGMARKGLNYVVTVNGVTAAYPHRSVNSIQAYGFAGSDLIQLAATVFHPSYLDGGDGADAIYGGAGDDVINAGAGNDIVVTGNGTNRVAGADGNDTITGGLGRDRIFGGAGNDSIDGSAGRDIVSGDEGNDTVVGGASNDTVYGFAGDDILNGLSGADVVDGGLGSDTARDDDLDTFIAVEILV